MMGVWLQAFVQCVNFEFLLRSRCKNDASRPAGRKNTVGTSVFPMTTCLHLKIDFFTSFVQLLWFLETQTSDL